MDCSLVSEPGFEVHTEGAPAFRFVSDTPIGEGLNERNFSV